MPPIATLLFDLDGTLTDPLEGITRSIQGALEQLGAPVLTQQELAAYIGPPLRATFAELIGTRDTAVIEESMRLYRQRYSTVGLFENVPYPGVVELLAELQATPYTLFVTTGKPTIFATRILEHFDLQRFFTGVYGSELDGRFDDKGELIGHMLEREAFAPESAIMIGDRMHDVAAGRLHGLGTIGVTYGYGSLAELVDAGADAICRSPEEILVYLRERRQ